MRPDLGELITQRDFFALRSTLREYPPVELAELIEELAVEEQVIVFRLLPRETAAEVFEYLPLETQDSLLKAMAQEDVAEILNNMSADDRTTLLEELPASVTKQLLALLTPQERATAVTLLGYPEGSIGRLMTPDYVRVKEGWTVEQVLDHVRRHGHDSETLNTIYVIDERGVLIDDIRIREFLLAPMSARVADLMDNRYVALKATDDQETAVSVFRQEDSLRASRHGHARRLDRHRHFRRYPGRRRRGSN
ncbi:MAG: CBS domain-containing protein [Pyrinomonadaceae bacterium]